MTTIQWSGCMQSFFVPKTLSYLTFNRDLFIIHPLWTILRSNRKRKVDNRGLTLFLSTLSTISNTIYPMRIEAIHSRLPKVCLLTTVFFAVSPQRLWMLRVVKKWDTSRQAQSPIIKPVNLPINWSDKQLKRDFRFCVFIDAGLNRVLSVEFKLVLFGRLNKLQQIFFY